MEQAKAGVISLSQPDAAASPLALRREIPTPVARMLRGWRWNFLLWGFVHYGTGLVGTVGAVIAARVSSRTTAASPEGEAFFVSALIIGAPVSAAILTFLRAAGKAKTFARAWRLLNCELIAFQLDPSYPVTKLADIVKQGEKIIAESD